MYQIILRKMIIAITIITTVFMLHATEVRAWWSCMYPDSCFREAVKAIVYENGERKEVLEEEDFQKISFASNFKAKWFFLELFE